VAAYLTYVAEEVRRILAGLGLRSLQEAVGRVDLLRQQPAEGRRADRLDLSPLLAAPGSGPRQYVRSLPIQRPTSWLGDRLCADAFQAVRNGERLELRYDIGNGDRTVGAKLGGMLAMEFGTSTPSGSVTVRFDGAAGQSFGAFLTDGVEFDLTGEANDYVGKGMGGGRIVIRPPADDAGDPHLLGNTVLYGATSGELFCAGRAGERFAVRNSGAVAVVEGVGEHACEYMTGGTVVVLGAFGRNIGAGMTGGDAFVHDPVERLGLRLNPQLVVAEELDEAAAARLHALLEEHAARTGSATAAGLLADWPRAAAEFRHVRPKSDVGRIEAAAEGTDHEAEPVPETAMP